MDLQLPKEIVSKLPEPGSDGIIHCTAGLKVGQDGEVELVEINDTPVPADSEQDEPDADDSEGEGEGTPDLGAMADQIYGRNQQ